MADLEQLVLHGYHFIIHVQLLSDQLVFYLSITEMKVIVRYHDLEPLETPVAVDSLG
jgi:hypothetical protein